ncbi:MAG: alpha-L-fucosidase [Kiritimatiellia bacterium]
MKTSAFLLLSVLCALSDAAPDPGPPDTAPIPDNVKTATQAARAGERAAALKRWHDAKFGLFLHWGVYSVYGGTYAGKELWSAEWIQENARIPHAEYAQTAAAWNPSDFNADDWARTARDAGMGYLVITARHHDGFAIYPSKAGSYNLFTSGAYKGPDPLAALKKACADHGLLFGVYYSPLEFRGSPRGFDDEDEKAVAAGFDYRTLGPTPYATDDDIAALARAQIREIVEWYKPDILWFDGTWYKMGRWTDDDARESERIIRSALPGVLINNRLGVSAADFDTYENEIPKTPPSGPWEYCWNMGAFWGYNPRNYTPELVKTPEHYIETLARIASLGGNYLLNIGPDPTGKFHPMAADYLHRIGAWVRPNREAVEGVSQSPFARTPGWGFVTAREGRVYLLVRNTTPAGTPLVMPAIVNPFQRAHLLGDETKSPVAITVSGKEWSFAAPAPREPGPFTVIVLEVEGTPAALE